MHPPSEQVNEFERRQSGSPKKESLKDTEILTASNHKVGNWVRPDGSFII